MNQINNLLEPHKKKLQFFVLLLFVFILGALAGENQNSKNNEKLSNVTQEFDTYKRNTQELIKLDNFAFGTTGEVMFLFSDTIDAIIEGDTDKAGEKIDKIAEYTEKLQTLKEQREKVLEKLNQSN